MRRYIPIMMIGLLSTVVAQGQIRIGGNVYGGGNVGDMTGNTSVTVYAGDVKEVYGGARVADVGGRTFVNIDGEHASDDILIHQDWYTGLITALIKPGMRSFEPLPIKPRLKPP